MERSTISLLGALSLGFAAGALWPTNPADAAPAPLAPPPAAATETAPAPAAVPGVFLRQEPGAGQEAPAMPSPEEMQAYMARMMELASPGPEHEELAKQVGTWKVVSRYRMAPNADWQESEGSARVQSALGGRWFVEQFELAMDFGGMPMEMKGLNLFGYDRLHERYETHWCDTMSTWMIHAYGQERDDGVIEFRGEMYDVVTPEGRPYRMTVEKVDDDHHVMRMYDTIPPVGEVLVMEVAYERVADGD